VQQNGSVPAPAAVATSNGNNSTLPTLTSSTQPQITPSVPLSITPNVAQPGINLAAALASGNFTGAHLSLPGYQQSVAAPVSQPPPAVPQVQPQFQGLTVATPVAPAPAAAPVAQGPAPANTPIGLNALAALGQIQLDTSDPTRLALQVRLVKALAAGQIPTDQLPQVLAALGLSIPAQQPQQPPQQALPLMNNLQQNAYALQQNAQVAPPLMPQNGNPYDAYGMQAQAQNTAYVAGQGLSNSSNDQFNRQQKHRQRSPSPDPNKRRRVSPPNRRKSPVYGVYDPSLTVGQAGDMAQYQQSEYDKRSKKGKAGRGGGQDPQERKSSPQVERFIGFDGSLQANHIRGL
jgi:protein NRD1